MNDRQMKIPPAWFQEPHVVLQPDQKGLRFRGDKKQALHVFDLLIARLRERGIPYNSALVPQAEHTLPRTLEKGTRQHAIFLFTLCLWMRGGTESDTAIEFLAVMYDEEPKLFSPEYFLGGDTVALIKEVDEALRRFKLGQRADENSVGWVYNMRKLARFWLGDPRKLMDDKPRFNVLSSRIISKKKKSDQAGILLNEDVPGGFMYFQEKMAGMIAYFLIDAQLVPMFYAPVPVDIHVLRILVSNQVIKVVGKDAKGSLGVDFYREEVRAHARGLTEWYCRTRKISPVALCDTLWLLSRSLCRRNPGNSGYVIDNKRQKDDRKRRRMEREMSLSPHLLGFGAEEGVAATPVEEIIQPELALDAPADSESDAGLLAGRKRYMGFRFNEKTLWKNDVRIRKFEGSCGRCPLQATCVFNISSAAYYVAGRLLPERLRLKAPEVHGSFLGHTSFATAHKVKVNPRVRFAPIEFIEG